MPIFRCYLTRHAETEWNVAGRLQGRSDSPLTARGRAQAEELAARAPSLGVAGVWTSPLGRARATAACVAQFSGVPCVAHDALAELSFGAAEGGTLAEARSRWPEWWDARARDRWNTRWPSGESYADAAARLTAWIGAAGRIEGLAASPAARSASMDRTGAPPGSPGVPPLAAREDVRPNPGLTLIVAHRSVLRPLLVVLGGWTIERAFEAEFAACEPLALDCDAIRPPLPASPAGRS